MIVWLVQTGEALPLSENVKKMRVALLADKLIKAGHSVIWWASAFDHFQKRWMFSEDTLFQIKPGLNIYALKGTGYQKNISLARFIDHRIIARKFKKLAPQMPRPDVVLASTPPHDLAYRVVAYAQKYNIPVIVDIRDEWPDFFLLLAPAIFQRILRILLAREFYMIKKALGQAISLTAMITPLLDWGLQYAGRPKTANDRVFYFGYKKTCLGRGEEKRCDLFNFGPDKFVVIFLGTITRNNNPAILIDCAERLKNSNILFVIAGDGEIFNELKVRASTLSNVIMPGWLNQEEMACLLENSHVGICPTPKLRYAFPNKAFAYLSAGLPLIMPFQGDLKEFAEKQEFGFHYDPNDTATLIRHIQRLAADRALYKKMSANAKKIYEQMFDADRIYEDFVKHIEKMAALRRGE